MKVGFICSNYYGYDAFRRLLGHKEIEPVFVLGLNERRFKNSGMAPYYYQGSRYCSYALGKKIPSFFTLDLNGDTELIATLKRRKAEYVFAMGWPDILHPAALAIPSKGCLGIHPSALPMYRGGAPLNWQLVEGKQEIGVSCFFLSKKVDAGALICQEKYTFTLNDGNVLNFIEDIYIGVTYDLYERAVAILSRGKSIPKTTEKGCYRRRRTPEDSRMDFCVTSNEVVNLVRAQALPFPAAFFVHRGKRYIVMGARLAVPSTGTSPGKIRKIADTEIEVETLDGAVWLTVGTSDATLHRSELRKVFSPNERICTKSISGGR